LSRFDSDSDRPSTVTSWRLAGGTLRHAIDREDAGR
jgi:hypothetical protein